jgi:hypothetical protein
MPGKSRNGNKKYSLGVKLNDGLMDVELPSGHTIQARRPGVQGLVAAGLLDNFDELTALVQTEHIEPNTTGRPVAGLPKVDGDQSKATAESLMRDPKKLETALHLMDRLAVYVIVQPPAWIDYQGKDETDEAWEARKAQAESEEMYPVRQIDLDDKMFLLNWAVGGSSDLAGFRAGTNELLGSVQAGPAV